MTEETQPAPVEAPPTKLYAAMARARSQMKAPKLDGTNPHFKSKYVTLAGLLEAVMPALVANGIHIWQAPVDDYLLTVVTHESGEAMEYRTKLPAAKHIQDYGSILTYMRRYILSGITQCSSQIDDDAEAAMPSRSSRGGQPKVVAVKPSTRDEL